MLAPNDASDRAAGFPCVKRCERYGDEDWFIALVRARRAAAWAAIVALTQIKVTFAFETPKKLSYKHVFASCMK